MVTAEDLHAYVNHLCREEEYEPDEGVWTFRSGGSCCRCVDAALKVVEKFGGQVVGYNRSQNPLALIGINLCEGHDFAIVAERFIIDYWAFRVARIIDRPVLDITQPSDARLVRDLYGEMNRWEQIIGEPKTSGI
jgi:hypothetical protein